MVGRGQPDGNGVSSGCRMRLRTHLDVLAVAVLLPVLVFSVIAVLLVLPRAPGGREADRRDRQAHRASVDRELARAEASLRVLASSMTKAGAPVGPRHHIGGRLPHRGQIDPVGVVLRDDERPRGYPSAHRGWDLHHCRGDPALADEAISVVVVVDGGDDHVSGLLALGEQRLHGADGRPIPARLHGVAGHRVAGQGRRGVRGPRDFDQVGPRAQAGNDIVIAVRGECGLVLVKRAWRQVSAPRPHLATGVPLSGGASLARSRAH